MAMPTYELPKARKSKRGFASMDPARLRELARKGGLAVPNEKRSFSKNRDLAVAAGKKGGAAGKPENRSFSKDKELARRAGSLGGKVIH